MGSHLKSNSKRGVVNMGMETDEDRAKVEQDRNIMTRQKTEQDTGNTIGVMDDKGNVRKKVYTEQQLSTEANFLGKPMLYTHEQSLQWNPFRKKSGILSVMNTQSKRNRMVSKHGRINTYDVESDVEQKRFMKDFFTSLIDLSWAWTIFSFAASFFLSWLFFAVIWYLIALGHGDLDPGNLEKGSNHTVCVEHVGDFTEAFLFSLETQHTIGYGGRATTGQCSLAIIIMAVQSIVGVVISACMAGIFFAKFTKPTCRGEVVLFSKNALISMRDGALYLLVRLGDLRQTHLIECHVSGHFLSKKTTAEGEVIPYHLAQMEFGSELDGSCDYIQPFWPLVVAHKIDKDSPLYKISPRDLQTTMFEIILTLEGTTPETGNTVQTRTSYLPQEILWGQRFEHTCVAYDKELSKYAISYNMINRFVPDMTPRLSAQALDERSGDKDEDKE